MQGRSDETRGVALEGAGFTAQAPAEYGYWSVAGLLVAGAAVFVLWRAWVADDAFITFRHVVNCLSGHGPVFNVGERVQGFTHPLWFLWLLIGGTVCDLYAFAILSGLLATIAFVGVLAWLVRARSQSSITLQLLMLGLLSSRSFVEYQTSGFENALTNLLLVLLLTGLLRPESPSTENPPSRWTVWWCALLILNRPDHVIICGPLLAWALVALLRRSGVRGGLVRFIAAMSPVLIWHGFATVYYGTPLPNTAYAKLGLPFSRAVPQGLFYAWDYITHEPVHAAVIMLVLVGGLVCGLRRRERAGVSRGALLCFTTGLWLHVAYVIGIGGDFARGRVLVPVLVGAVVLGGCLLTRFPEGAKRARLLTAGSSIRHPLAICLGVVVAAGVASLYDARPRMESLDEVLAHHGVADEYAWYAGRWDDSRFSQPAMYPNAMTENCRSIGRIAARYSRRFGSFTICTGAAGLTAYHAGAGVVVIDLYGLTDPFVARCPVDPRSRIGHIEHRFPPAYLQARGAVSVLPNWLQRMTDLDPGLEQDARRAVEEARWVDQEAYRRWQRIHRAISGNLFSWERIAGIPGYAFPCRGDG
jgi:arabinofuranosyltransferase